MEFDGLVVTPYVTDKGRMAYSLRATGDQGRPPAAGKDSGLMPVRRVTTVTVPVDGRSGVALDRTRPARRC